MINLKQTLAQDISEGIIAAQKAGELTAPEKHPMVVVDHAEKPAHGDYASPIALALTKQVKKPPMEIVEIIAKHMPKKEYISELQAAAPGFLNIWINESWLASRVDDIIEEDICADIRAGEGTLVNLEFISANPTGPLTLGNARTAFSADTLGNVLDCAGYNVTREYYINDAGSQIRRLGESVLRRILQIQGHEVEFPEDLYQGEYIHAIADTVAEKLKENEGKVFSEEDLGNEELITRISTEAMEMCLSMIKKIIHDDLKIHFDVWTSERALRKSGLIERALDVLREKKLTYEKDGAQYLKTTEFGDDQDRVLVKQDGEYAYIAPDIGYHLGKYERKFDVIFTFLGADHQGHVPKLRAAMQALGQDTDKLHFVVAQWMALVKSGQPFKPSKRKGYVYGPQELIAEIGYDAARFFMVQHNLSSHMELDLDIAKERSERNPVYYVQYAYVRLQSILRKAKERGLIDSIDDTTLSTQHSKTGVRLTDAAEFALMRQMYRLPEVVTEIAHTFEIHRLAYYATDLAKAVHVFYKQVPVLSLEEEGDIRDRLQLILAARKVLGQTLDLLGINKPDVM